MTDALGGAAGLQASLRVNAGRALIALSGDIDRRSAPLLADLLHATVDGDVSSIDVDMAEVSFVDIAGLRVLSRAHRWGVQRGVALTLRRSSPGVVWLLEITGTAPLLLGDVTASAGRSYPSPPESLGDSVVTDSRDSDGPAGRPAGERDRQADERDRLADERERQADERELVAEDRRRLDVERNRLLEERHQRVLAQQQWEDIREDVANEREQDLERRERDC